MTRTKEYYLKLSEQHYESLGTDEKLYLNEIGLKVKQLPTEQDLKDEKVIAYKKEIAKSYDNLDKYLFENRNK
jgi:hypothetical protein